MYNFIISDGKGSIKQVSQLIKQNKSRQSTVDALLERDKDRDKTINAIGKHLEALSTRSFADCMPDLLSISASSDAEDSITIDYGLKSAETVSGSSSIKPLSLHDADSKDVPNAAKGLIFIYCLRM